MQWSKFLVYLLVAAGTTYLIRMLPLALLKKKIKNRFLLSFLYYVPYAVLSVMTIPAVFYATSSVGSAAAGVLAGVIAAHLEQSLLKVACLSTIVVFIAEYIINTI